MVPGISVPSLTALSHALGDAGTRRTALPQADSRFRDAPITVIVGGTAEARAGAALAVVEALAGDRAPVIRLERDPASWMWARPDWPARDAARVLLAIDVDRACPAGQTGGTRLVLTQSTYLLQRWRDVLAGAHPGRVVVTAARSALETSAPEAFRSRGPWQGAAIIDLGADAVEAAAPLPSDALLDSDDVEALRRWAFIVPDAAWRLSACRRIARLRPDEPPSSLALASACMEAQATLDEAHDALRRALAHAPDWPAAWFEQGKYWLRLDDMEQAAAAFRRAGELMPSFAAAFSNLGATLGELDQPDAALAAFEQALRVDPHWYTLLNNIGVVTREMGRLADSEAALRRVTTLAPDFVFGYYNLGHTLFLQGRYQASLAAYAEGQRRDPQKNPRQASRLAMAKLAAGDAAGAKRDLERVVAVLPRDERRDVLAEVQEILWALFTHRPDLAGWREIADLVKARLA